MTQKPPPRRLSNDPNHPDYQPDYLKVGLRVDGKVRTDIMDYDCDKGEYHTRVLGRRSMFVSRSDNMEPYWRAVRRPGGNPAVAYVETKRPSKRAARRAKGKARGA